MPIGNAVIDNDACFRIDPITRNITDESAEKTTLVQYDHNSERFTFSMPRYVEGHDVLGCDKIEVHYKNKSTLGVYEVTDVALVPGDEENVVFTWLVSQNATKEVGAVAFLVRLSCCDENANTSYVWNTSVFTGVSVKAGMNNSEAIVEQYADVLEQWKRELDVSSKEDKSNKIDDFSKIDILSDEQYPTAKLVQKYVQDKTLEMHQYCQEVTDEKITQVLGDIETLLGGI